MIHDACINGDHFSILFLYTIHEAQRALPLEHCQIQDDCLYLFLPENRHFEIIQKIWVNTLVRATILYSIITGV